RPNARAMLSGNANASEATVSTMVRNSPPHRFIGTASSSTALLTSATAQERLATSFSRGLAGSRKLATVNAVHTKTNAKASHTRHACGGGYGPMARIRAVRGMTSQRAVVKAHTRTGFITR